MPLTGPEAAATYTNESPFRDGTEAMYFDRPSGWMIANDSQFITLTRVNSEGRRYFSGDLHNIARVTEVCPAARAIYAHGTDPEGRPRFMVSTVTRVNAFPETVFRQLNVAGISAVQTKDVHSTPPPTYLRLLPQEENGGLPIAWGHSRYLHDMVGHYLGAISTERQNFTAFGAVCLDADQVYRADPMRLGKAYTAALARGWDVFTEISLRKTMSPEAYRNSGHLLGHCLAQMAMKCQPLFDRAAAVVNEQGMGMVTRVGPLREYVVPWEEDVLPAHYELIADRLSQAPANPLSVAWAPSRL